jgi:hypothetical protein
MDRLLDDLEGNSDEEGEAMTAAEVLQKLEEVRVQNTRVHGACTERNHAAPCFHRMYL